MSQGQTAKMIPVIPLDHKPRLSTSPNYLEKALVLVVFCTCPPLATAQTRILPPYASWIGEGHEAGKTKASQQAVVEAEIPVPLAAWIALPFVHVTASETRDIYEHTTVKHLQLQGTVGLLHHASEGAPLWKAEAGRWGRINGSGYSANRATLNLEKMFPVLRPYESDTLDSWVGVYTLSEPKGPTYFTPELGWSWLASNRLLIDFAFPYRARMGYRDHVWMGVLAFRRQIVVKEVTRLLDDNTDGDSRSNKTLSFEEKRSIMLEASRSLGLGFELMISAGIRLPHVPSFGASILWTPESHSYSSGSFL